MRNACSFGAVRDHLFLRLPRRLIATHEEPMMNMLAPNQAIEGKKKIVVLRNL